MWIDNCFFWNSKEFKGVNSPAVINVQDTSLGTATLHWSGKDIDAQAYLYSTLHLKLFVSSSSSTANNTRQKRQFQYYGLGDDQQEMKKITAKEYKEELEKDTLDCLSCDIACRDISIIIIKFNDLPRNIILNLKQ